MFEKTFYLVKVTNKGKDGKERFSHYGKCFEGTYRKISLDDDNSAWYIKEYGYYSYNSAYKAMKSIRKYFDTYDFSYSDIQVDKVTVEFESEEEYLRVANNRRL